MVDLRKLLGKNVAVILENGLIVSGRLMMSEDSYVLKRGNSEFILPRDVAYVEELKGDRLDFPTFVRFKIRSMIVKISRIPKAVEEKKRQRLVLREVRKLIGRRVEITFANGRSVVRGVILKPSDITSNVGLQILKSKKFFFALRNEETGCLMLVNPLHVKEIKPLD